MEGEEKKIIRKYEYCTVYKNAYIPISTLHLGDFENLYSP